MEPPSALEEVFRRGNSRLVLPVFVEFFNPLVTIELLGVLLVEKTLRIENDRKSAHTREHAPLVPGASTCRARSIVVAFSASFTVRHVA